MPTPISSGSVAKDPLVGTVVANRYRVIARLGQGGMGVTYRAWDMEASRPVVLKHPKPEMLASPELLQRFSREARMMAAFSHPCIVPVATVGEHEGIPYIVMPFLPGGSLSNRRSRDETGRPKPMPAWTLRLWLTQVADALDYIHSQGVVHRDVKPGNLFFDAFWHAYVGDFGIAKIVAETAVLDKEHTLTATSMAIGTQEYMAPEMFAPKAVVDGRVDQYALAVMVYEMLAGRRPFTGDSAHVIVEVTTRQVPTLRAIRSDLPPSLEKAVYRALSKLPDDRYRSCRAFADAVLADVPLAEAESDIARLLCPACANLLKLPTSAAGHEGKCPRCRQQMTVATDLSAMWLLSEESGTTASPDVPAEPLWAELAQEAAAISQWDLITPTRSATVSRSSDKASYWTYPIPVVRNVAIAATAIAVLFAQGVLVYEFSTSPLRSAARSTQQSLRDTSQKAKELEDANVLLAGEIKKLKAGRSLPQTTNGNQGSLSGLGERQPRVLLDKTLVAWTTLSTLEQQGGSVLSIQNRRHEFDAIVFGEAIPRRWLVGSDYCRRWPPLPNQLPEETSDPSQLVQVAITYHGPQITFFRDGVSQASYLKDSRVPFATDDASVILGVRAIHPCRASELFAGQIEDVRIYDGALSANELRSLKPNSISDRKPLGWWHFEDGTLDDAIGTFSEVAAFGGAKAQDGRLVLNGTDAFVVYRAAPLPQSEEMIRQYLVRDYGTAAKGENARATLAEPLDLLGLIDPLRDTIAGEWKRVDNEIESPAGHARLQIPVRPPSTYEFVAEFTRLQGNDAIVLTFPVEANSAAWLWAGWGNAISGVDMLDYLRPDANRVAIHRNAWLTDGKRHTSKVRVARDRIQVLLDEEKVMDAPIDWKTVSVTDGFRVPQGMLGLSTWSSPTRFHKLTLAELPRDGRSAVSARYKRHTMPIGGGGGGPYEAYRRNDKLVGLAVSEGNFAGHHVLTSVQAIFSGPNGIHSSEHFGPVGTVRSILAKPGYAIGALVCQSGHRVDGFKAIFMRDLGDRLDEADSYESDWVGGSGGGKTVVSGYGEPVVGIFGGVGLELDRLGLVVADEANMSGLTIVKAIYGIIGADSDVTGLVAKSVSDDVLIVSAANRDFGDPAPDRGKAIDITYHYDGTRDRNAVLWEGQKPLVIHPCRTCDTKQFQLSKAWCGSGVTWTDITRRLRDHVPEPSDGVSMDAAVLADILKQADLPPGAAEHVVVEYEFGGQVRYASFAGGEAVDLPLQTDREDSED